MTQTKTERNKKAKHHHELAMKLMEEGLAIRGDVSSRKKIFLNASRHEEKAAKRLGQIGRNSEASVLYRSAATMAFEAGLLLSTVRLSDQGLARLASNPNPSIASELEQLKVRVYERIDRSLEEAVSAERLDQAFNTIAQAVLSQYRGHCVNIVCIAKGGLFWAIPLMERLKGLPVTISWLKATRTLSRIEKSASVKVRRADLKALRGTVTGQRVLLIDDIIDTGTTLNEVRSQLMELAPKEVRCATLFWKRGDRISGPPPILDYEAIEIEDRFVVGRGLDYCGFFRDRPNIYKIGEHADFDMEYTRAG